MRRILPPSSEQCRTVGLTMVFKSLILPLAFPLLVHAQYSMVKEYIGETFFNDWNFYGDSEC